MPIAGKVPRLVLTAGISKTLSCATVSIRGGLDSRSAGKRLILTDGDNLQIVGFRPVDQPRGELIGSRGIRLVHQRDVAVPTGTGCREFGLTLGG